MGVSTAQANEFTPEQVADINPGAGSGLEGSVPSHFFTPFNGELYFIADDGNTGQELWKSDGTAAGTTLVKDINPGAADGISGAWIPWARLMTVFNNELYFMADDGTAGIELWKTDGTEAGTTLVADINPGAEDGGVYREMVVYNNELYFVGDDGPTGEELWKTDGTEAGTTLVRDIWVGDDNVSGPRHLLVFNNLLFFFHTSSDTGVELWRTDGTEAGTFVLEALPGTNNGVNYGLSEGKEFLALLNGELYFAARGQLGPHDLWKTDGTEAGTTLAVDLNDDGFLPEDLTVFDGAIYFSFGDTATSRELWKTDGTPAGTTLVKDVNPGADPGLFNSLESGPLITGFNGELYFMGNDGVTGEELWKTDGTDAGTTLVADINPGLENGLELLDASVPTVFNGDLYFTADDGVNGRELWKTDGTEAGTVLVEDINPGDNNSALSLYDFQEYDGALYFQANDGVTGVELWRLTDTPAEQSLLSGTLLDDLNEAGTAPADYFDEILGSTPFYFPVPGGFQTPDTGETALLFRATSTTLEGVRKTIPMTSSQTGGTVTLSFFYGTRNIDSGVLGGQLILTDSSTGTTVATRTAGVPLPSGSTNPADGPGQVTVTVDVPDGATFDEVTFGIGHRSVDSGFIGVAGITLVASTEDPPPTGGDEVGVCLTAEEAELAQLINTYRGDNGLPDVPVSKSLTTVAQYHVRDLHTYRPDIGTDDRGEECNLHSWSENGPWSAVCYTSDHYYAEGMWNKPDEITDGVYTFTGYENAYYSGLGASAQGAFDGWANSAAHNAVILEEGVWDGKNWPAMGVGIYEGFAVLWFGDGSDPQGTLTQCQRRKV